MAAAGKVGVRRGRLGQARPGPQSQAHELHQWLRVAVLDLDHTSTRASCQRHRQLTVQRPTYLEGQVREDSVGCNGRLPRTRGYPEGEGIFWGAWVSQLEDGCEERFGRFDG